jgi:hypothetical protein
VNIYSYLARFEDTLRSRQDTNLEFLNLAITTMGVLLQSRLRLYDGSVLIISEELEMIDKRQFHRQAYSYHYQKEDGTLVFRYDNSPHYPRLASFPDHKHIESSVIESSAPDLIEVLKEIDGLIYR